MPATPETGLPFAALRRLAAPKARPELCEFCSVAVRAEHRHLLEVESRRILCVCDACGLRFEGVIGGRFELIPREVRALTDFCLSDAQWESLALPINLAFFVRSRADGKMRALYPGPAGVTESLLTLEHWQAIAAANPAGLQWALEVEALLVNRVGMERDYLIVPIDRCYELVGLIRLHWRGLAGGEAVWGRIRDFFNALKAQAVPEHQAREAAHA